MRRSRPPSARRAATLPSHRSARFINDLTHERSLCMCGGYGNIKTLVASVKAVSLMFANPGREGMVASASYQVAEETIVKAILELLDKIGIT